MTELNSWFTGGSAAVLAVIYTVKSYFTKRKEYDSKIIQLEQDVAVIQNELKNLKERDYEYLRRR